MSEHTLEDVWDKAHRFIYVEDKPAGFWISTNMKSELALIQTWRSLQLGQAVKWKFPTENGCVEIAAAKMRVKMNFAKFEWGEIVIHTSQTNQTILGKIFYFYDQCLKWITLSLRFAMDILWKIKNVHVVVQLIYVHPIGVLCSKLWGRCSDKLAVIRPWLKQSPNSGSELFFKVTHSAPGDGFEVPGDHGKSTL